MDIKKIYRPYTPSRQDEAFLECTTTGRKQLLDDLFSSIRVQWKKPTHQHWMLIGPRGIGKSHIVALLHHKIENTPELNSKWLTICFPEEAAGIISLRDFMDKIVSMSNDLLEKEGLSDQANEFKDLNKRIHEQKNDRKSINQIRSCLIDWKDKNHRKILILLENADRLIGSRIAKNLKDEKWLRDLLMNHDLFLIIGTSPTFFDHVINKDHPLYELFRIEVLEDMSFDESLELLINYAQAEKRTDLVREFKTKTNRIKAIYTLTGGNPRLLIMLYILVQDSVRNIDEVETGFYNLLEELTPYFQYRLGQLTAKEEKLLVAFAEGPELLTPAEVGRKIRMATNVVTANLKRLQQAGFIKRIEKPIKGRKGTLYRLSETIYRYWYQMNSERNREMAEIFIRFIVLYYTYKELNQIYSFRSSVQAKDTKTSIDKLEISRDKQYIEKALKEAKYVESDRLIDSIQRAKDEGRPAKEITAIYQELVELHPDDLNILNQYAIFLIQLGKFKEAINYFQEITKLADEVGNEESQYSGYLNWGNALSDLAEMKSDEALFNESFGKYALAVKYKKDNHEAYNNWGTALLDLARMKSDEGLFNESFEKYALAVKYKKDNHEAYYNWGNALLDLAEMKSNEALFIESFEKYALAWNLIKNFEKLTHPLMSNTGLTALRLSNILGNQEAADQIFSEIIGSLGKVGDFRPVIPFFFDFFKWMANKGKIAEASSYLERLLKTRFKKELNHLMPFKFLFQYFEKKDDSIIRRQPPELQKILNELIEEIEQEQEKQAK